MEGGVAVGYRCQREGIVDGYRGWRRRRGLLDDQRRQQHQPTGPLWGHVRWPGHIHLGSNGPLPSEEVAWGARPTEPQS